MVGDVALGSDHPIRIQTMTTTDTKDVAATVEQVFEFFRFSFTHIVGFFLLILILIFEVLIVCFTGHANS